MVAPKGGLDVMAARKKAEPKKETAAPRKRRKKNEGDRDARGLEPLALSEGTPTTAMRGLEALVTEAGGRPLVSYRDPLGGHWQCLAALPLDAVAPTPFQRDLSEAHVARLTDVMNKLDRFLDPIITVPSASEGHAFWTPNGNHRLASMRRLGARAIVALVIPDREVAYRILALNTEKAHNLREKALEVIRMARDLSTLDDAPEQSYALELEEPAFATLGLAYEARGRFSGGAYHPILRRVESFLDMPLSKALGVRGQRAEALLKLDDAVVTRVDALKARGLTSPYLKSFVIARINPLRFAKGEAPPLDVLLEKMRAAAEKLDISKVRADQIAATGGPPEE